MSILPYPTRTKELGKPETQDVHGEQYGDFVIHEVMPLIQKKYRVWGPGTPDSAGRRMVAR
jgi:hypothetical protein